LTSNTRPRCDWVDALLPSSNVYDTAGAASRAATRRHVPNAPSDKAAATATTRIQERAVFKMKGEPCGGDSLRVL
jgi:hypothetical protein